MSKSKIAVVAAVLAAGSGCAVQSGEPSGRVQAETLTQSLETSDVSGLVACDVEADHADCLVDPAYPVSDAYDVTVDWGGSSTTFVAPSKITASSSSGTKITLFSSGFAYVYSWTLTETKDTKSTLGTQSITTTYTCIQPKCGGTVVIVAPDKPPIGS